MVDPNKIIPISKVDRACMCCSIRWDRYYKYYILGQKFFPLGCGPIFTLIFQNCHHFSIIYPPLRNTEPLFSTCSLFHWGAYLCFVASFPFQTSKSSYVPTLHLQIFVCNNRLIVWLLMYMTMCIMNIV